MHLVCFIIRRKSNESEDGSYPEPKHVFERNNVRIHLNEILDWVVFDYILLIFYNFIIQVLVMYDVILSSNSYSLLLRHIVLLNTLFADAFNIFPA